ncbi:MAG: hypothetical protein DRP87_13820 [Spirochaetes bacterium]|nr:MAG: hypothetical protein DRP87_13820 [Spirochaetota bacterium]
MEAYIAMKLRTRLLVGFLSVSAIVLIAGTIGIYTSENIGASADLILEEKVPVKDISMEAIIFLIAGRDTAAEYMIQKIEAGNTRENRKNN